MVRPGLHVGLFTSRWCYSCLLLSLLVLLQLPDIHAQSTDLGGGIVTRSDVTHLADLALDARDIAQSMANGQSGSIDVALSVYVDGKNSEPQIGQRFPLSRLSTELSSKGIANPNQVSPPYLFHLYGLAGRSNDVNELANHLTYADTFVRDAITGGKKTAGDAVLVLNMWMYAVHQLYDGLRTCQLLVEADNPSQFTLGTAGFDEFIALWIGTGQTPGSGEGFSLYSMAEDGDLEFSPDYIDDDDIPDIAEAQVNRKIKSLYQEAQTHLSVPGVCSREQPDSPRKLWSIMTQMVSQTYVPLLQKLMEAILVKDVEKTQLFATAVIPQAAQCRPSTFKRLNDFLLASSPKFDKTEVILRDLHHLYACFGLTCDDVGEVLDADLFNVKIPRCVAATARAPMAGYNPTSDVHPIAKIDQDILQMRILTSLGSFQYAKFWYLYGRNSRVPRQAESDPNQFYSIGDLAVSVSRKIAEPYYSAFVQYFNDPVYADTIIRGAVEGTGKWGGRSPQQRAAVITEGSAFLVVYIHLLAQINDAVNHCRLGKSDGLYDVTHPWDEVAALLIGSLEGTEEGGSADVEDGQLLWSLGTRRGFQFRTLNKSGYANVNSRFEDLLYAGKGQLDALECDVLEETATKLKSWTLLPLFQTIMKYAITNQDIDAVSTREELALGEVFGHAVIPILQIIDPPSAAVIETNMVVEDGRPLVLDGAQAVADVLGSAAVAAEVRCSSLGSTADTRPCRLHSSASTMRPLLATSICGALAVVFGMLV